MQDVKILLSYRFQMPLLNRKEFVRLPVPEGVDPDSEVFYLETSGEVFLDYE